MSDIKRYGTSKAGAGGQNLPFARAVEADGWSATVFADNLTDERQAEDLVFMGNSVVSIGRFPNTGSSYGVEFNYDF